MSDDHKEKEPQYFSVYHQSVLEGKRRSQRREGAAAAKSFH